MADPGPLAPPRARRTDCIREVHGFQWTDAYAWMEGPPTQEILDHIVLENAFCDGVLGPLHALIGRLHQEFVANQPAPKPVDLCRTQTHIHFVQFGSSSQQLTVLRRRVSEVDSVGDVVLRLGDADGRSNGRLGCYEVSSDESRVAFSVDELGTSSFTLYVKRLSFAEELSIADNVSSAKWSAAGRALFFTIETGTRRYACRYLIETYFTEILYSESDDSYRLRLTASRSGRFLLLKSANLNTSEYRALDVTRDSAEFVLLRRRCPNLYYDLDHCEHGFLLRISADGHNYRLALTHSLESELHTWVDVRPSRPDVQIADVLAFKSHIALIEASASNQRLVIVDLRTNSELQTPVFDELTSLSFDKTSGYMSDEIRYWLENPATPRTLCRFDIGTTHNNVMLLEHVEWPAVKTQRVEVPHEGVRIPLTILTSASHQCDGTAPGYLYGYGAYGALAKLPLSTQFISLLRRGVVIAVAHVRGGGDLGNEWHCAGRLSSKRNSAADLIRCAEFLMDNGYIARDRLIAQSSSAGGVMLGGALNERPELFKAAVAWEPFFNVRDGMLDTGQPLSRREIDEWGDPADPTQFGNLLSICPYSNLAPQSFPDVYVRAGLFDRQVPCWDALKYAAGARHLSINSPTIVVRVHVDSGHGGPRVRSRALTDEAEQYAFMLSRWGIPD